MFHLQKVLKEEEWEPKDLDNVFQECLPFIRSNKKKLLDDFFLVRGSKSGYDITKKSFRERKTVFSPGLFYFYNQFKPSSLPKREELTPCFGDVLKYHFTHMNSYYVFPVGENYKMYYHPEVEDFNYNDLIENYDLGRPPYKKFYQEMQSAFKTARDMKDTMINEEFPFSEQFYQELGRIYNFTVHDDMKIQSISELYSQMFRFYKSYESYFHEYFSGVKKAYDEYRGFFREYFSGLRSVKKLELDASGNEVDLYDPDGFYYVSTSYEHRIKEKIKSEV